MTERQLIQHANQLLIRPRQATAGLWARASALLARQALELSMDKFWTRCGWEMQRCSFRSVIMSHLMCLLETGDLACALTEKVGGIDRGAQVPATNLSFPGRVTEGP